MLSSLEKEPPSLEVSGITSARPLAALELDNMQEQVLLSIARRHCKLVLEHGKAITSAPRRQQIREEIQSLRLTRDDLIAEWHRDAKSE
ncbi:hypothetical protein [Paenibacillus cymbidii]|uniref:hypothetical protein n=1 Tax=Paenibacillus cymbidii TaxID=1639034 RepID=UPI0010806C6D|nr:hypothetical protein [Paenibacillus cymbidii]